MVILLKHDHYPVIVNSLLSSKHYQLGAELAIGRLDDIKNTTLRQLLASIQTYIKTLDSHKQ